MHETPDELVELRTVLNELEAGMLRAILSEAGIASSQHTANGIFLGAFGANPFNPTTIRVRREDVARANEALDNKRKDSVDIDWDEVDVGEPADRVAAMGASAVKVSRMRKIAVRSVGLTLVLMLIVAPFVGAIVHLLLLLTPFRDYALVVSSVAGLLVAAWMAARMFRVRRVGRHDADVFGTGE